MNILLVNLYDSLPDEKYVSGRYTYLSKWLSNSGHNVKWISSCFYHGSKVYRNNCSKAYYKYENIEIYKLWAPAYYKNIGIARLYNDYYLSKKIIEEIRNIKNQIDIVIMSTAPIITPNRISRYCRQNRIMCIVDVQDVYPFAFLSSIKKKYHRIGRILLSPIELIVRNTLNNATAITSLSVNRLKQSMSMVTDKGKMSRAIYLNYKGTPSFKKKDRVKDLIRLGYLGQIGKSYDLDTVIRSLEIIKNDLTSYTLDIFGEGPNLNRLKILADKLELDNIIFHGFVNFDEAKDTIQACDVGLVPYAKSWPPCIPNKPIDYFGLGIPVLNSIEGELSKLISDNHLGYNYMAGDISNLVLKLRQIAIEKDSLNDMGYNCYLITEKMFMPDKIMRNFESFISSIVVEKSN